MNKNGFTLIELIVVVIILGILSATALPKMINLKREALLAKLTAVKSAMHGASNLVYAKAYLEGATTGWKEIMYEGDKIEIHSGYPTAWWSKSIKFPLNMAHVDWIGQDTLCPVEWCALGNMNAIPSGVSVGTGKVAKVIPKGYTYNQECGAYFINRKDGTPPVIGIETNHC